MNTPGTALIGYAVLRANFNHQATSYLDNFIPFVISAIAVSRRTRVDKDEISETIKDTFGISIPSLAIPKLIRRMRKGGLAVSNNTGAVSLTQKGINQIPDLSTDVELYRARQNELVEHFGEFIEREYPQHLELTTRDLAAKLAEFFDRHSVSLVKSGIDSSAPANEPSDGYEYAISAFINHLYKTDLNRFEYVIDAAKGAMLSTVLDIDTSFLSKSLNDLTIILDSPVLMDTLGYHGSKPQRAIRSVLDMAITQGARLALYDHIYSELEGILQTTEASLRAGAASRSTSRGYLHFLDEGATPADVAILRANLEPSLNALEIYRVETPGGYRKYGLDEDRLEQSIQDSVRYLQTESRTNDVKTVSAVHRMRRGDHPTAFEKTVAVLVSTNISLIKGVKSFSRRGDFPLALSTESLASILWLRNPAMAEDVPRDVILASAYAGMQPPPVLWRKYIDEVERLETLGSVSAEDAIVLRSTPVGREAFMEETLGTDSTTVERLPLSVLERVHDLIEKPLKEQVETLKNKLATTESAAENTSIQTNSVSEGNNEPLNQERTGEETIEDLRSALAEAQEESASRIDRVRHRSRTEISRYTKILKLTLRAILFISSILFLFKATSDPEYGFFTINWILAAVSVVALIITLTPKIARLVSRIEHSWTKRRIKSRLSSSGFSDEEIENALKRETNL